MNRHLPRESRFPRSVSLRRRATSRTLSLALVLSSAVVLVGPIVLARRQAAQNLTPQATDFVRQVPMISNDLVYNGTTKQLYASVPSSAGPGGNSIVSVDPATGITGAPVFIGSEPKKLALSSDNNSLYVSLEGSAAIRKFDVPSNTPGAQFALGQDNFFGLYLLTDLAVAPGNPNLVAVARSYRGV